MIRSKLLELKDEKYRKFSSNLLPGVDNMIGVRLPLLRKMSKSLTLDELSDDTFEEVMLQGMVIGHIKDFKKLKEELIIFLPKINNWSICDSFVSSLTLTKIKRREMFQVLKSLKDSKHEYTRRFILVMLLHYFLDDIWIKDAVALACEVERSEYYTKMAYAWFTAEVYYQDEDLGKKLMDEEQDDFVKKKSLSKIKESNKIKNKNKGELLL